MFIVEIWIKLRKLIKLSFYKIIYASNSKIRYSIGFRSNFNIFLGEGAYLSIGEDCFFNNGCSINCLGKITIGSNSIFGENVKLYDHNHKYNNKEIPIAKQGFSIGEIKIGSNCWIGSNVTILKDVELGDNVVIGAHCLIYKSVPSNTIVKTETGIAAQDYY